LESSRSIRRLATSSPNPAATPTTQPFEVTGVEPQPGTSGVSYNTSIELTFSQPLAPGSVMPQVQPDVAGSWSSPNPETLVFQPQYGFPPDAQVTVTVPGGAGGVEDSQGQSLVSSFQATFTVQQGSVLRLQQLLASLGYLPVSFTAAQQVPLTEAAQLAAAFDPPAGQFTWRWANTPAQLESMWTPGQYGVMTRGAVMAFESASGLATDGIAGPEVWTALIKAVLADQTSPYGYSWVEVSETLPETLKLWHDGAFVITSLTNTGVTGANTPVGTWPIYLRYLSQTMSGTDPNGTHYVDPGVPYVNYFYEADAVHGFVRASYGFPQSNGCVELPVPVAAKAWGYLYLGALVTVNP
jgi:hypothetical protein